VAGPNGTWWDLTVADYDALGGVAGAVGSQAAICWNPATSSAADEVALREAFLDHLVTLSENGLAARRAARLVDLPERSQPMVRRFVDARLLVSDKGVVEIAHEALFRTWEPLKKWLEEGREELERCRRVSRLCEDLSAESQEQQRRGALEQLAGMAARGGSEARAVVKEAVGRLAALLRDPSPAIAEADKQDAALVLALIGEEEPLGQLLADGKAPVGLRRRAAECLGLLAQRTTHSDQRHRIKEELERWLRSDELKVRINVELDPEKLDPAVVQEAVQQAQEQLQQALASGQLVGISEEQLQEGFGQLVVDLVRRRLSAEGKAAGWKELDERLPLLQGASRGLQLAAAADLPRPGSGERQEIPMLTLTALEEDGGLWVRTEVVEVPVWRLPLPGGEQLELVAISGGTYEIGSPKEEDGRDVYTQFRQKCEPVDVEAERTVQLAEYWMVRHPISQAQWRAVVEDAGQEERGSLKPGPGTHRPEGLWEDHGQPGALPVDSVSWNDARQWLELLNRWLERQWAELGGSGEAPKLTLPSESQWEAACRAGIAAPFHFGATLDPSWANVDGNNSYGMGRKGIYRQRPVPIGFFGLVNRWGLAELHGQMAEWCGDQWHRDPLAEGWSASGEAREGPDPGLADVPQEREYRLLRGGSWIHDPRHARAAMRHSRRPDSAITNGGLRPCCSLPPGFPS
jgi:formylglycine-generating enzyme required for sulfatase activity